MDDGLGVQPGGQQHTRPRRRRPLPGQPGPYGWVGCPAYPVTPSPQRHLWCRGVGVGRARGATAGPRLVPPPRLFRPSPFQHRGRQRRAEGCRHTHLAGADARPCTPDDQPPPALLAPTRRVVDRSLPPSQLAARGRRRRRQVKSATSVTAAAAASMREDSTGQGPSPRRLPPPAAPSPSPSPHPCPPIQPSRAAGAFPIPAVACLAQPHGRPQQADATIKSRERRRAQACAGREDPTRRQRAAVGGIRGRPAGNGSRAGRTAAHMPAAGTGEDAALRSPRRRTAEATSAARYRSSGDRAGGWREGGGGEGRLSPIQRRARAESAT